MIHQSRQFIDDPILETIPREWNTVTDRLVNMGRRSIELSLFHQGKDLPRWLMRACSSVGFGFSFVVFLLLV